MISHRTANWFEEVPPIRVVGTSDAMRRVQEAADAMRRAAANGSADGGAQANEALSRLRDAQQKVDALFSTDIPAFNRAMQAKGVAGITPVKEVLPEFPPEREEKDDD